MVYAMVVIGGITRLTESGLSMVHWNPISGAIPPLDHAQWVAEFDAYPSLSVALGAVEVVFAVGLVLVAVAPFLDRRGIER